MYRDYVKSQKVMMYKCFMYFYICVVSFKVSMCDRRITNGKIDHGRKYVVYLLNSLYSENQPEAWLCGGVLISTTQVLTSAACLTEVSHMYVIAGYKKYVSSKNIEKDICTRTRKQKIVKIFIPKAFNGSTWMQYDIGIGVVEKSYDFMDLSFRKDCSYEPGSILINYDMRREAQATKSPVLALGWGATEARVPGMVNDTNSGNLMKTYTMITNTTYCQKQFPKGIEYLFLCTDNPVDVEAITGFVKRGREMISLKSTRTPTTQFLYFKEMWRCHGKHFSSNETPAECLDSDSGEPSLWRRVLSLNDSATPLYEINDKNKTFDGDESDINQTISRKQGKENVGSDFGKKGRTYGKSGKILGKEVKNFGGICQNDHGGPLIIPDSLPRYIIGVALNSVYDKKYQCKGPFLYLSTARAGNLIKCLSSKAFSSKNPKICSNNYEVKEYDVSWPNYPPAAEQEASKNCVNGECEAWPEEPISIRPIPVRPIPVRPIPVRPKSQIFNMGLQYKRPKMRVKFLNTRPNFNMGMFTKRPIF